MNLKCLLTGHDSILMRILDDPHPPQKIEKYTMHKKLHDVYICNRCWKVFVNTINLGEPENERI